MKSISVKPDNTGLALITSFIEDNTSVSEPDVSRLCVIADEIAGNILSYSNADSITVELNEFPAYNGKTVQLVFRDNGYEFNPLEAEEPDITLSAEERKIGGLGIFLVKKMSDSVLYSYENGYNVLTVSKFFTS